jgi:hypothetical protein
MIDELDPERLRRLRDAVASLPRSIEPERDAWPAIRERIEARRVRSIAPGSAGRASAGPRRVAWFAAAAVALVTVSSGLTMWIMRGRAVPQAASAPAAGPPATADSSRAPAAPPAPGTRFAAAAASISPVFARYDAAAADLASELDARRARLDPRTVAVLDSCIRRIDAAIAEARTALRQDPKNLVITELLTVSYRQKLDLLKRAADLPLGSF